MIHISGIQLNLSYRDTDLPAIAARELRCAPARITGCRLFRRSVDARRKPQVRFTATLEVTVSGNEAALVQHSRNRRAAVVSPTVYTVPTAPAATHRPVVVGAGPSQAAALRFE